jgi:hypothetical protein
MTVRLGIDPGRMNRPGRGLDDWETNDREPKE